MKIFIAFLIFYWVISFAFNVGNIHYVVAQDKELYEDQSLTFKIVLYTITFILGGLITPYIIGLVSQKYLDSVIVVKSNMKYQNKKQEDERTKKYRNGKS